MSGAPSGGGTGEGGHAATPGILVLPLGAFCAALAARTLLPGEFDAHAIPVALALIVVAGLPHGTLDIGAVRESQRLGRRATLAALGLYLVLAAAMAALWLAAPVAALGVFLVLSALQFSEDWQIDGPSLASLAIPVALFSAGALRDREAYDAIFTALTRGEAGTLATDWLVAIGPLAQAGGAVAIAALAYRRRPDLAAAACLAIAGMWLFEPVIGFALYFAAYHSPMHLRELAGGLRGGWRRHAAEGGTTFALALLMIALASGALGEALGGALGGERGFPAWVAGVFITLSVLTVPHMLVPRAVRLVVGARARRPAPGRPAIG